MCRITLYSLNKDDDTHIPNLIAINLKEKFIAFFCIFHIVNRLRPISEQVQ